MPGHLVSEPVRGRAAWSVATKETSATPQASHLGTACVRAVCDDVRGSRPFHSPCPLSPRPRAAPRIGPGPQHRCRRVPAPPSPRGRPRAGPVRSPGDCLMSRGPALACVCAQRPYSPLSLRALPRMHPILGRYILEQLQRGLLQVAGLVCQSGGRMDRRPLRPARPCRLPGRAWGWAGVLGRPLLRSCCFGDAVVVAFCRLLGFSATR